MSAAGGGINNDPHSQTTNQPSTFLQVFHDLENFAINAWHEVEAGAIAIEQKLAPIIENTFVALAHEFGQLAVQTVIKLMANQFATLTGQEKHGMTVATIIQTAEAAGKAVLVSDAQALAQNAFVAVTGAQPGSVLMQPPPGG